MGGGFTCSPTLAESKLLAFCDPSWLQGLLILVVLVLEDSRNAKSLFYNKCHEASI